jgi:hypothetical protein
MIQPGKLIVFVCVEMYMDLALPLCVFTIKCYLALRNKMHNDFFLKSNIA